MADIIVDYNEIEIDKVIEIELRNFPIMMGVSLLIKNVLDVINRYIEPVVIVIEFIDDEEE